jgi:hypothetical protein
LKKAITKNKGLGGVAQGIGPEFNNTVPQKKGKKVY